MKAILVDPFARSVREVEIKNPNRLQEIYLHTQCDCIDIARINSHNRDGFFVDDEGLLKDIGCQEFFIVADSENRRMVHMLAGRALLVGFDDAGDTVAPSTTLEEIERRVLFINNKEAVPIIAAALGAGQHVSITLQPAGQRSQQLQEHA